MFVVSSVGIHLLNDTPTNLNMIAVLQLIVPLTNLQFCYIDVVAIHIKSTFLFMADNKC